jgi:hypothetical protein
MAIYYHELPSEAALAQIRQHFSGSEARKWLIGGREGGVMIESFMVQGIECQVIHITVTAWQQQMKDVLEQHVVNVPLHKAMSGMQKAIALFGEADIAACQAQINDFPAALAEKMVQTHLVFFPIWALPHQFSARDGALFYVQSLLEAAQNLLGVLAGLNHCYYTTFQFKYLRQFVAKLKLAPPNLAERLEQLFNLGVSASAVAEAGLLLEGLLAETVVLLEHHLPQVNVEPLRRRLGLRPQAWQPGDLAGIGDITVQEL